jgi:histidinol-phosphate aminotransferase
MYNSLVIKTSEYKLPSSELKIVRDLGIIENRYPQSEEVIKTLKLLELNDIQAYHRHDELQHELEHKLIDYLNSDLAENERLTNNNIFITNGSDGAIEQVLKTFCNENDLISYISPTYPHFEQKAAMTCNVENIVYDHRNKKLSDYNYAGKLIYIVNPNMPFGYDCYNDIRKLLDLYPEKIIIVDEAYIELSNSKSFIELIESHPNLIVFRSFSKAFGLAGIRLGYCVFNQVHHQQLAKTYSIKNLTRISVKIGIVALNSIYHYQQNWSCIKQEYKRVSDRLNEIVRFDKFIFAFEVGCAPFFMLYVRNTKLLCKYFEKAGLLIRDKSSEIPYGIRILIDIPEINDIVLQLLKDFNSKDGNLYVKSKNNYSDLDGTIRNGSEIFNHSNTLLEQLNATVITNNVDFVPTEILQQISQLKLDENKLITPLANVKKIINEKKYTPYIIGSLQVQTYLNHIPLLISNNKILNIDDYDMVVVCGDVFAGGINYVGILKYLLNKIGKIYVFEIFDFGPLYDCINEPFDIPIYVPYIGDFLKLIDFHGEVIDFGKVSYRDPNFGIMIGDVYNTDGILCQKNNGLFIYILNDNSPLKWVGTHFTVGNVNILFMIW